MSNVGRKRGRGKAIRKQIDLNRGQIVGQGREQILLPGLNMKTVDRSRLNTMKVAGKNENFDNNLLNNRGNSNIRRTNKIHPLERGWFGTTLFGRSIGIPEHLQGELKDFDCKVILQRAR